MRHKCCILWTIKLQCFRQIFDLKLATNIISIEFVEMALRKTVNGDSKQCQRHRLSKNACSVLILK